MSAAIIQAERGQPYRLSHNGNALVLERDGRKRLHTIAFTTTDAYRIANVLVDLAEQIDRNN
ncbi:hypothetical protein [Mycolicibacterium fortuitum]|uniref:hypothetical protein n=1 Tax=Mycolicibacterium fortuitum TaxID=1766 RepID=UPI0007EAC34B|nr:hypothetical protein [Mycolicibacterium fortuitum]OBB33801.1 hypothetical protein A5763_10450 [Mycolicibacterium fortuitum]OBB47483.1 hypothetical protein A5754_06660 [Mycolicibacterium fortuitum]OBB54944.1 hypothetical protein A5755_29660 [Mycolicibacterium fortuitum]OBF85530.1 hypothetical protein A5751_09905 [Mycolicibacterium fortuitum]OBG26115.1 hypothetical protein A5768_17330 [Mycolicibacterium fortuitum]